MFHRPDFIAIGDITTDAFIRLKEAEVHCRLDHDHCEICMPFGDKIPFEYAKVVKGVGNAPNAAVAAARLGLRSALISNIGGDQNGRDCMAELQQNKVITSYIRTHSGKPTNYHFVLWYGAERTILVNHVEYEYALPKLPTTQWVYITSMAAHTLPYHEAIASYLEANPDTKVAFQPGTFQLKAGFNELSRIYARTDVFVVNVEEAERLLGLDKRPMKQPDQPQSKNSAKIAQDPDALPRSDVKKLLSGIAAHGPKLVLITDGPNGAYMFDGDHYYFMPIYPDPKPPFERTGCGDAFASTFVSVLALGMTPLEALTWAPVNPMSVAQFVGAQEGLLSREQIEWWLKRAPGDYKVREI